MTEKLTPFPCSPTEIKLLLRLRQLTNQNLAHLVLLDLAKMTISLIKSPEALKHEGQVEQVPLG
jgi:hypothetical protein